MPRSSGGRKYNPTTHRIICNYHKNRCVYCGEKFHYTELTREHIIPLKADWYDGKATKGWANIVPACSPCNNARGSDRLPDETVEEFQKLAKKAISYKDRVMRRWNRMNGLKQRRENGVE